MITLPRSIISNNAACLRNLFFIISHDATEDKDVERKQLSLAEKLVKSAKCIVEPLIKLPICNQRTFHHLNHRFGQLLQSLDVKNNADKTWNDYQGAFKHLTSSCVSLTEERFSEHQNILSSINRDVMRWRSTAINTWWKVFVWLNNSLCWRQQLFKTEKFLSPC